MPVHVDQLSTEVIPEAEPPAQPQGGVTAWQETMRVRELQSSIVRDRLRTAAEGFDD